MTTLLIILACWAFCSVLCLIICLEIRNSIHAHTNDDFWATVYISLLGPIGLIILLFMFLTRNKNNGDDTNK